MLNYEKKLEIMDYFNQTMNTPYLFIVSPFKPEYIDSSLRTTEMHFTVLENKIRNNENINQISSENLQKTDKNLILGLNKSEFEMDLRKEVCSFDENTRLSDDSIIKQGMYKFDDFVKSYRNSKEDFEKENFIFLNWLSDKREEGGHLGISLLNSYSMLALSNSFIGQEFVKAYSSKEWTKEEFLILNTQMINPIGLLMILEHTEYSDFISAFEINANRLKLKPKDLVLDIENDKRKVHLDPSLEIQKSLITLSEHIFAIKNNNQYLDYMKIINFPSIANDTFPFMVQKKYLPNRNIAWENFKALVENEFIQKLTGVKKLLKEGRLYGFNIKPPRAEKQLSPENFIEILPLQRNYEYIVFDVKLKGNNHTKIIKALEMLSEIMAEKTQSKINFYLEYPVDKTSFCFKIDSRCIINKDDFSMLCKDLLLEMFSLDVKTAPNQMKSYNEYVPMIETLINYANQNMEKNNSLKAQKHKM